MKKYQWQMPGLVKGIDPDLAGQELERIRNKYGNEKFQIAIVKESKKEDAILHNYFEWDNKKAGEQWRLQQARKLINNIEVIVISNGEEIAVSAYEIVTEGYQAVETFTVNDIDIVRKTTLSSLKYLRDKLDLYNQFAKAKGYIEFAIKELES